MIEKDLRRGTLVNFLRKQGSHKLAEAFQVKICSENATDDHERLLLADIQCDLELTSAQETLEKVFKADSKKILESLPLSLHFPSHLMAYFIRCDSFFVFIHQDIDVYKYIIYICIYSTY